MKAKGTYFLDSYLANKARAKPDDRARAPRRRSALSHPLSHSAFPARAPPDRQRGLQQGLLQQRPLDPAPRRALRQRTLAGGGAQAMPLWVWLTCRSKMSPVVWARCRMCVCVLCACSYDLSGASRCDGRKVDCACTVKKSKRIGTSYGFICRDRKLYSVVECDHSERPQSSSLQIPSLNTCVATPHATAVRSNSRRCFQHSLLLRAESQPPLARAAGQRRAP